MLLLGGAIGAGLFVGSGSALATGGPGSLVCATHFVIQKPFLIMWPNLEWNLNSFEIAAL
jgi:amino acid permease